MAEELVYLDSSALVKLVLPEPESQPLFEWLADWPLRLSSDLAAVEVPRAARRASREPAVHLRASQVLAGLHLLQIDREVIERAAALQPAGLRSLDAIHLASALSLGPELGAVVVYDDRLAEAAAHHGLPVQAPA